MKPTARLCTVLPLVLIAASLVDGELTPAAAQEETTRNDASPEDREEKRRAARDGRGVPFDSPRGAAAMRGPKLWWNDPAVGGALGLSDEQRQSADALWDGLERAADGSKERRQAIETAVQDGRFEEAETLLAEAATAGAEADAAKTRVLLQVVRLLDDEQRRQLVDRFPRALWSSRVVDRGEMRERMRELRDLRKGKDREQRKEERARARRDRG